MSKELKYFEDPEGDSENAEEYLQEFKDHIWPAYASFGFTIFEALMMYKLNCIYNRLDSIEGVLREKNEDKGDNWK